MGELYHLGVQNLGQYGKELKIDQKGRTNKLRKCVG